MYYISFVCPNIRSLQGAIFSGLGSARPEIKCKILARARPIYFSNFGPDRLDLRDFKTGLGCRVKANCQHVGPGYTGEMPSVGGGFLRDPSLYLHEFLLKAVIQLLAYNKCILMLMNYFSAICQINRFSIECFALYFIKRASSILYLSKLI